MIEVILQIMGGSVPVIGAAWYLSQRLTTQDDSIQHLHSCVESMKPDVEQLKEDVREIKNRRGINGIGFRS